MRLAFAGLVLSVLLSAPAWPVSSPVHAQSAGTPGEFDYFILALSWSPTFCASGGRRGHEQCRERHDTIVHGLWPQYRRGWPAFCATDHPQRLPARLLDRFDAMTPDRGLLAHQWRKHGVCTGLAPEDYFSLADRLHGRIRMPDALTDPDRGASYDRSALVSEIAAANPGMAKDMLVLTCEGDRLDEIRFCLDREGEFRTCSADVRQDMCRARRISVPSAPGR